MAYYRRIKELREDHDKTQRDIAAVLDMPQSQYWRYEVSVNPGTYRLP